MKELYFQTYLTENEHYIVEDMLRVLCVETGAELVYYRQLKRGHVPMYREVKIRGGKIPYAGLKQFVDDDTILPREEWEL